MAFVEANNLINVSIVVTNFVNRPNRIEITEIMKEQILRSLLERSSLRSICRIFKISLGRLVRFIQKQMEKLLDDLIHNITEEMTSEDADYVVDELCQFVNRENQRCRFGMFYIMNSSNSVISYGMSRI